MTVWFVAVAALVVGAADAALVVDRWDPTVPAVGVGACLEPVGAESLDGASRVRTVDPTGDLVGAEVDLDEERLRLDLAIAGEPILRRSEVQGEQSWAIALTDAATDERLFRITLDLADADAVVGFVDNRGEDATVEPDDGWAEPTIDETEHGYRIEVDALQAGLRSDPDAPLTLDISVLVEQRAGEDTAPFELLEAAGEDCAFAWPNEDRLAAHVEDNVEQLDQVALLKPTNGRFASRDLEECEDLAVAYLGFLERIAEADAEGQEADDVSAVLRSDASGFASRFLDRGCTLERLALDIEERLASLASSRLSQFPLPSDLLETTDCGSLADQVLLLSAADPQTELEYVDVQISSVAIFVQLTRHRCFDQIDFEDFTEEQDYLDPGELVNPSTTFNPVVGRCYSTSFEPIDEDAEEPEFEFVGYIEQLCDDPHEFQLLALPELEGELGSRYPGEQATFERSVDACLGPDRRLLDLLTETEDVFVFGPDKELWDLGVREVLCLLIDIDGYPLIGDQFARLGLST